MISLRFICVFNRRKLARKNVIFFMCMNHEILEPSCTYYLGYYIKLVGNSGNKKQFLGADQYIIPTI